jgi:hypothetical protein
MRCTVVLLLPLLLAAAAAAAQVPPDRDDLDLPTLVGLTLQEALERWGAPAEVFAARGEEPWQDDVVFYYPPGFYLFWYQNRVWQARVDARFGGTFLNLSMGRSREQVLAALGPPMREVGDSLVYHLEDRGYPVRLRLYFRGGTLADAYCYRGDL